MSLVICRCASSLSWFESDTIPSFSPLASARNDPVYGSVPAPLPTRNKIAYKMCCTAAALKFFILRGIAPRPPGRGRRDCGSKVKGMPNGIRARASKPGLR